MGVSKLSVEQIEKTIDELSLHFKGNSYHPLNR